MPQIVRLNGNTSTLKSSDNEVHARPVSRDNSRSCPGSFYSSSKATQINPIFRILLSATEDMPFTASIFLRQESEHIEQALSKI